MGKRGPKPKTKTRASISARLRALGPVALDKIEDKITHRQKLSEDEKRLLDQAWRVIEQVEGKPKQSVDSKQSGEIILRVKYDD